MSKTAVCGMCGLEYDPEDGLVHDKDGNGNEMCYDCTMKIRNAVPEELGGAPEETPMRDTKGLNYIEVEEAKLLLDVLSPIKGVCGKDADLLVRTTAEGLSIVMSDQARASEIEVQVDLGHEDIIAHEIADATVCVSLEKVMAVVKTFGTEEVIIAAEGSDLIIQSKTATWRIPQITTADRPKLHAATFPSNGSACVPLSAMRRILFGEDMAEVFVIELQDRMCRMTAESESGREMLTVRAEQTASADFPVRSQFGYDVIGDVVSKIRIDPERSLDVDLMDRGPMEIRWTQGAASIRAVFAPRN